jgi:hypothetical protein
VLSCQCRSPIRTKFLHCFQKHDRNSSCNFVSWVCSKFLVKVSFILMCTHFSELMKSAGSHGNSVTSIHDEGDDYLTLLWVTLIRLCKSENPLSNTAKKWDTNAIFIKEKTSFKGIHVGNMVWCNTTIMMSIFLTNYKYAKPPLWPALAFEDMQWEEPDLWCWLAHNTVKSNEDNNILSQAATSFWGWDPFNLACPNTSKHPKDFRSHTTYS